jgi:hypothetical protein
MRGGLTYVSGTSHQFLPLSAMATVAVAFSQAHMMRERLPKHWVPSPSPLPFKCRERSWLRVHFHSFFCLSSKLYPAMSSLSGFAIGGDGVPEGSGKKAEASEMLPPASRKRRRPKGSRNKKTLAALVATAAATATTTAATGVALAPSGEGVPEKWGPGHPRKRGRKDAPTAAATSSPSRRRGRPPGSKNKKTLAALGDAASDSTRTRAMTSSPGGPSRLRPKKPALQPPAYLSAEGWSTYIVPVLAGAEDLLRLPSQFAESMEGQEMAPRGLLRWLGGMLLPQRVVKVLHRLWRAQGLVPPLHSS